MLTHEKRRGTVTVRLSGDLDHNTAAQIREELDRLIDDPGVRRLVFDLSELGFMDSSGIGVIMGRYKLIYLLGGEVWAVHANERMKKILTMSGVTRIIQIYEEEEV